MHKNSGFRILSPEETARREVSQASASARLAEIETAKELAEAGASKEWIEKMDWMTSQILRGSFSALSKPMFASKY